MNAYTTREIAFVNKADAQVWRAIRYPAGTLVHTSERRGGTFRIRVPHTLHEQDVYLSAIEPA